MTELERLHGLIDRLPPERVRELLTMLEGEAADPVAEAEPPKGITGEELRAMLDL